jgi:hypothetical protein
MKSWEDKMKDLNAPRRESPETQSDAEIISLEKRRMKRQGEELRTRWTAIQSSFVDNPQNAIKEANALVSSAIQQIEQSLRDQLSQIENQSSRAGNATTEDLRITLQHYRAFLDRLNSLSAENSPEAQS